MFSRHQKLKSILSPSSAPPSSTVTMPNPSWYARKYWGVSEIGLKWRKNFTCPDLSARAARLSMRYWRATHLDSQKALEMYMVFQMFLCMNIYPATLEMPCLDVCENLVCFFFLWIHPTYSSQLYYNWIKTTNSSFSSHLQWRAPSWFWISRSYMHNVVLYQHMHHFETSSPVN